MRRRRRDVDAVHARALAGAGGAIVLGAALAGGRAVLTLGLLLCAMSAYLFLRPPRGPDADR